jgi:transcriptional regulator with XRE-family HTH domain
MLTSTVGLWYKVKHWRELMDTSKKVRMIIDLMGLTVEEFAGEMGVTIDTVWAWLAGRRKPDGSARKLMIYVLDKYLWDGVDKPRLGMGKSEPEVEVMPVVEPDPIIKPEPKKILAPISYIVTEPPKVGDVRSGRQIQGLEKYPYQKYIWRECEMCGDIRWVKYLKDITQKRCIECGRHDRVNSKKERLGMGKEKEVTDKVD